MASIGSQTSILIVSSDPDDRSVLFKRLDVLEFDAIYTAYDFAQARSLLRQELHIDLAVIEFIGDEHVAMDFCRELRESRDDGPVMLIGIMPREELIPPWLRVRPPPDISDWIQSPVEAVDALARIDAVLSGRKIEGSSLIQPLDSQYQSAFEHNIDELLMVDPVGGRIVDVNATCVERSGFARVQIMGARIDAFYSTTGEQRSEFADALATEGMAHCQGRKQCADRSSYAVEIYARVGLREGQPVHVYTFRKIDDLGLYQQAMAILANMAHVASGDTSVNSIIGSVVDWLDIDFVLLSVILNDEPDGTQTLIAHCRPPLVPGTVEPRDEPVLARVMGGEEVFQTNGAWRDLPVGSFARERRYEFIGGLPMRDARGVQLGGWMLARREALAFGGPILETLRIITHRLAMDLEARRAREEWRARGLQDALTGLPNRLLFNDRLDSAIKEAQRSGESFAVIFVDLDRFKNINDSLGHGMGDQVLLAVAKRLRASVRAPDTVARYAGDEFTLILRHIVHREDVLRIAEKIVRVMETPLTLPDKLELHITATLGVSFYPDDALTAEDLVKYADEAMYTAKSMGRNNFMAYVAAPEESHKQRFALEEQLRQAQRNGELRVHYQPMVDAKTEDILGMEALVRWEHQNLG